MNTIIVIGAPGEGKSEVIKQAISGNNSDKACFIFDIQNEYGDRTKYPGQTPIRLSLNIKEPRSRYIANNVEEFIRLCQNKRRTICVFEEATAFFEGKTGKTMRKHLIDRWHTQNVSYLLFHSISSVPPRIMEMSNFVVLFRTNDEEHKVKLKYSKLLPYFLDLQKKPKGTNHVIQLL
jgi:hypothetical protein